MDKIKVFSNIIGGYSCIVIVLGFWTDKIIKGLVHEFEPFKYAPFDFLEQATPLDPIDFANIIFSIYKFILCVILV